MKIDVQKNHLLGQILYRSLALSKNGVFGVLLGLGGFGAFVGRGGFGALLGRGGRGDFIRIGFAVFGGFEGRGALDGLGRCVLGGFDGFGGLNSFHKYLSRKLESGFFKFWILLISHFFTKI